MIRNTNPLKRIGKIDVMFYLLVMLSYQVNASEVDTKSDTKPASASILVSRSHMPQVPPSSRTSAVYMSIKNTSDKPKILEDVTSPNAQHTMIHQSQVVEGTAKMSHLSHLAIAPGETIDLSPGGLHIMLMGLLIEQGAKKVTVVLKFKDGDLVELDVPIISRDKI